MACAKEIESSHEGLQGWQIAHHVLSAQVVIAGHVCEHCATFVYVGGAMFQWQGQL
jgi:hypothetical protein